MTLKDTPVLLAGERGPLASGLAARLAYFHAPVLREGEVAPGARVPLFVIVWAPEPGHGWRGDAVVRPIALAAGLDGLEHLCLARTEEESASAYVLEHSLGMLARQRRVPLAVVTAFSPEAAVRLADAVAFAVAARMGGRVTLGVPP